MNFLDRWSDMSNKILRSVLCGSFGTPLNGVKMKPKEVQRNNKNSANCEKCLLFMGQQVLLWEHAVEDFACFLSAKVEFLLAQQNRTFVCDPARLLGLLQTAALECVSSL